MYPCAHDRRHYILEPNLNPVLLLTRSNSCYNGIRHIRESGRWQIDDRKEEVCSSEISLALNKQQKFIAAHIASKVRRSNDGDKYMCSSDFCVDPLLPILSRNDILSILEDGKRMASQHAYFASKSPSDFRYAAAFMSINNSRIAEKTAWIRPGV